MKLCFRNVFIPQACDLLELFSLSLDLSPLTPAPNQGAFEYLRLG